MEYVAAIIAFLATVIGVLGETRKHKSHGLGGITWVGYFAAVLAVFACALSMIGSYTIRRERSERTVEAATMLADASEDLVICVNFQA
jgi:hypothetical protein